jgi:hypothetical protein
MKIRIVEKQVLDEVKIEEKITKKKTDETDEENYFTFSGEIIGKNFRTTQDTEKTRVEKTYRVKLISLEEWQDKNDI